MAGVFVVWLRRSYKNLVVLGVYPLRYRSGWQCGRGSFLSSESSGESSCWRTSGGGSDPDVPAQDPTWRDRSANTRSTVALVLAWLGTWTHLFTPPIVKPDNYFPSGVGDPSSVVWDSASVWANNIGSSLGYVMLGVAALLSFCLVDQFSNRQQQRHGRIEDFDRKLWLHPCLRWPRPRRSRACKVMRIPRATSSAWCVVHHFHQRLTPRNSPSTLPPTFLIVQQAMPTLLIRYFAANAADEPESDRHQTTIGALSGDAGTDRAADRGDDEKDDETHEYRS